MKGDSFFEDVSLVLESHGQFEIEKLVEDEPLVRRRPHVVKSVNFLFLPGQMDRPDGLDDVHEALPFADFTGNRPRDVARIILDGMQQDAAQLFLPETFRFGVDGDNPLEMKVGVLALFENLEVGMDHLEFELVEADIAREDDP